MLANLIEQVAPDEWSDQFFTLVDAYQERPPLRYTIDGLFPEASLSIVYGPPGGLKSMLMSDATLSVAAGLRWIGRNVEPGPALWIDFDNGKRRTHERFAALAKAKNLPENTPIFYVSMPSPWLNAGSDADVAALIRRINLRGISFLVIDNLGLVAPGADENSDAMIPVLANFRRVAEETGAAVVLIHHQRKSTAKNTRAGESLRGHSSIESALDLALRVDREEGSNTITMQSTKTRDRDVPAFGCEFQYEHKPGTSELRTAGFMKIEVEDNSDAALKKEVEFVLEGNPNFTQQQVIDTVKTNLRGGVNRIRRVINEVKRSGRAKR